MSRLFLINLAVFWYKWVLFHSNSSFLCFSYSSHKCCLNRIIDFFSHFSNILLRFCFCMFDFWYFIRENVDLWKYDAKLYLFSWYLKSLLFFNCCILYSFHSWKLCIAYIFLLNTLSCTIMNDISWSLCPFLSIFEITKSFGNSSFFKFVILCL